MRRETSPLDDPPPAGRADRVVGRTGTCCVEYREFRGDGRLRHSVFRRVRADKTRDEIGVLT
ncbi:hypothetical protein ACFO5K_12720 [Nocardia halotolerans]|uniref:DNA ligase (ATP) n=1 Tax=Nocardia halotolerans TaxID=1755878 RepID=A0ABV8VFZ4_9NOCA